ncbi:hypothetical protein MOK15_19430 [Sphingobium sp. BYY-5]|uniref:hypothetical protein n=1 Tax=Sphingobium sp. BYY-5 TaxID=2926400 RepID=UPI001FA71038|nr:hypothetical protein [Sphingobium sp. BYY-5]MCI4592256.1 hypothetical protein [Sphingobium sp. BYY-5]
MQKLQPVKLLETLYLYDILEQLFAEGRAPHLLGDGDADWIAEYKRTTQYHAALSRVRSDRHDEETVSSLSGSDKFVVAETQDRWSSVIIRTETEYRSFSVLASAAVIHIVECKAPFALRWAAVDGLTTLQDIPAGARLGQIHAIPLREGDTLVVPAGLIAVQLNTPSERVMLLRFNGELRHEIDVAFDEHSRTVRSVSFNNPVSTAHYFFATLASELTRTPGLLRGDEADCLATMFLAPEGEEPHMFTQWKMAQTLGRIRPAAGLALLERIAAAPLPAARTAASAALSRLKVS